MKGIFTLAAALLLAAAAPQAQAQDLPRIDDGAVRACMAATPPGRPWPDCLGAQARMCQDRPGGSTTMGIAECIMAETAAWDGLLNEEYKSVRAMFGARGDGAGLNLALRDAQRAWIAFRDAECALAYARWQDGSIRTIVAANCQMTMTAQRALELRDMKEG